VKCNLPVLYAPPRALTAGALTVALVLQASTWQRAEAQAPAPTEPPSSATSPELGAQPLPGAPADVAVGAAPPLAPPSDPGAALAGPGLEPYQAAPAPATVLPPVAPPPRAPSFAPAVGAPAVPAVPPEAAKPEPAKKDAPWYEKLNIRGYSQLRYNRIPGINRNDKIANPQGDRFMGDGNGFGFRRARVILFGDVHEHVSVYLQTDFASVLSESSTFNVANVRDWYADIFFDKDKTFRLRAGQSKVPYGFENLQSSQNRLPLDRNDALNSGVKDERDIGLFLYWAPKHIRARFKHLVDSGLKGSGDYGVLGLGIFNGQTANRAALDDNMHGVLRATWPLQFGEQFVEISAGGYYGEYTVTLPSMSDHTLPSGKNIRDARVFGTLVVYPQPFGFQAEGTWGTGPSAGERDDADAKVIKSRELFGGYAQLMYKIDDVGGTVALIPFVRGTYYEGGKKFENNAPFYSVKELEIGIEWQIWKALELVAAYDMVDRTVVATKAEQKGHLGRLQLQFNY